jgi:hypothetical protein
MPTGPKTWTREEIERHSLDMRQFIDFRQSTLPNGMRIIDAYNSSGLTFTLLPDRGLDIWTAHYKGIPLTWISPGSPHPPDFGRGWLEQFNGGLLTTCGLTHVGPAEVDDVTGERRDIHGKYSRLRAENVQIANSHYEPVSLAEDEPPYERYELIICATVHQSSLFGEQLELRRTIWQSLAQPDIGLSDHITNIGDKPAPLMLLYHLNLGFPLIQEGSQLYLNAEKVYPRDAAAKAGYETWARYDAPTSSYPEQVFFHHLKTISDGGFARMLLVNATEDLGLKLQWDTGNLPYFTQWKNTRQGIYVCGFEPGNCIPEGQNAARKNGRLVMLEPGQSIDTYWSLDILEGSDRVKGYKAILSQNDSERIPIKNCQLDDYADV